MQADIYKSYKTILSDITNELMAHKMNKHQDKHSKDY